ncbi:vacuolar protein sorting-associated protein 13b-like isoform X1 [Hibiscus syriacus]|nr:vacuolar protein sorting-associated protein 13b-like isoform X1 [Hibiscus syriacus]
MLERVVHQVLLGYLGRYVKDFSKDQVKVTLWNIEVELKDIDLILEAFDYLQLPFALKQGRVGRLSIKVPWSLIGGEPILIALENVFFPHPPGTIMSGEWMPLKQENLLARRLSLLLLSLLNYHYVFVIIKEGGHSFPCYHKGS